MTQYLYTIRTELLDVPCINKSFVCTFNQFKREFSMFYPEMNFDIPEKVLAKMGDASKVGENCLVLMFQPNMKLSKAAWLCHENLSNIVKLQKIISDDVKYANKKNIEFNVNYIQNKNEVIEGKLQITPEDWSFKKGDEVIVAATWAETQPFVSAVYMKEVLPWKGSEPKPEEDRCLKVYRKKEVVNNNPDYFCVYMSQELIQEEMESYKTTNVTLTPEDIKQKELAMSRFEAQTYVNKMNMRLQNAHERESINKLSALPKNTLNIDSEIIGPIKTKIRDEYLKARHDLLNDEKNKGLSPADLGKKLNELKAATIKESCKNIDICISAMNFSVDKGLLPLSGEREKFSMDKENPYNHIAPQIPIQIKMPDKDSPGKKVIDEVAKLKGAHEYFAENIPEGTGAVPLHDDIKKAYNTVTGLKENKAYANMNEVKKGCKSNERNNITSIRRRLSFMMYSGDNDIFFDYLGYLRDYQFHK